MQKTNIDITVLGGLPITVTIEICGADPDVGWFNSFVESFEITHINNKKCKKYPQWLDDKIVGKELERVLELLNTYIETDDYYDFE